MRKSAIRAAGFEVTAPRTGSLGSRARVVTRRPGVALA